MSFFNQQSEIEQYRYEMLLKIIGALSKLSSDSDIPYLYYRMAENIFCKAFNAINLSRSDLSIDARKGNIGIGLKTFINKNAGTGCIEKIAEFNKCRNLIDAVSDEIGKIKIISKLRNERLETTSGTYNIAIPNMLYHCVSREKGKFLITETDVSLIRIDDIAIKNSGNNAISFYDGLSEYSFNFSKSTLYKRFYIEPLYEINIDIFNDPYQILEDYLTENISINEPITNPIISTIYLPLYSERGGKNVQRHSGLNQWNAAGRQRNPNEVYIPVPIAVRRAFPDFFPPRETSFTLRLPSGSSLMAKICQDNGKALMSAPNLALGKWLLRDVLRLEEGELVTYRKLEEIGVDSVEINKFSDNTYEINFKELNTYEAFQQNELQLDEEDEDQN